MGSLFGGTWRRGGGCVSRFFLGMVKSMGSLLLQELVRQLIRVDKSTVLELETSGDLRRHRQMDIRESS